LATLPRCWACWLQYRLRDNSRTITGRMMRRGAFHSADELEQAIYK
jgi:hypothetical protein